MGLQRVRIGYRGFKGLQGSARSYMVLQRVTTGFKGF